MMIKQISVNNLLGVKYLSKDDINLIFETADSFKEIINIIIIHQMNLI